ncbi:MAG: histidine--tRNA ligase [bacterium]
MAKEQGPMSGFRDLLAEQMLPRDDVLDTIKEVYGTYGFVPLKTPALERLATLTGKYGDEGEGLMYRFKDNGGRDVAMRYDHTVPLARVVAQYGQELPKPYKRFALGEVWRGESPQAGRYREFAQFDADIVGSSSYLADSEVIAMMSDAMSAIGVGAVIRVNDRRLLDGLAQECGITDKKGFLSLIGSIDKVDKIGQEAVVAEIEEAHGISAAKIVDDFLSIDGTTEQKLLKVSELVKNENSDEGIGSLSSILGTLAFSGYSEKSVVFDQTIARGLSYYTGTIYETTLTDLPSIGSVCSGGRYDKLIEQLGGPDTPAVGTSIGVDRLMEAMRQLGVQKDIKTRTQVYVTKVDGTVDRERFAIVQGLRKAGIAAELVYEDAKLGKQIKAIDKLGVEHILIVGTDEVGKNIVILKNLETGEQTEVPNSELANKVASLNNK